MTTLTLPAVPGDWPDRLLSAARARTDRDVERLVAYAGLETTTGAAAALDAFADVLTVDAEALGATVRRVPLAHGDALVVDHPGRGRGALAPALLVAHHDTVHPMGSLAGGVPLRRDGDRLYGPGVFDMKGGLVVALAALELLADLDHRPVRLVVTPDEEIGSPTSSSLVVEESADVAYALGLEAPHLDGAFKTSRRGSTRLRLDVTGRASHAAVDPGAGVSAIDELVDRLVAVRGVVDGHPDVLCNVGALGGGGRTNVVPAEAHAEIGLRFVTRETETAVLAQLGALPTVRAGAVVATAVLSSRPAWGPSSAADELLVAVADVASRLGQVVVGRAAPGAADTNLTGAAGVPTLDGFGPLGGGAHAVTEHVLVGSLPERAALIAAVLHAVVPPARPALG